MQVFYCVFVQSFYPMRAACLYTSAAALVVSPAKRDQKESPPPLNALESA